MNITTRLATPEDASAFAQWAEGNLDIPRQDIDAVAKATPLTLVVEIDGQPELYIPLLPALTIGYLGFRPGQTERTKAKALRAMLSAVKRLQDALMINDAYVFTKAEYPMGKWALKHGFKQKSKDGFVLERQ